MIYCGKCGNMNDERSGTCVFCGAPLDIYMEPEPSPEEIAEKEIGAAKTKLVMGLLLGSIMVSLIVTIVLVLAGLIAYTQDVLWEIPIFVIPLIPILAYGIPFIIVIRNSTKNYKLRVAYAEKKLEDSLRRKPAEVGPTVEEPVYIEEPEDSRDGVYGESPKSESSSSGSSEGTGLKMSGSLTGEGSSKSHAVGTKEIKVFYEMDPSVFANKWRCSYCDVMNGSGRTRCKVCGR